MSQTETGKHLFENITEEGRLSFDELLLENGHIILSWSLKGEVSAISSVSGTLTGDRALKGTISAVSSVQGILSHTAPERGFYYAKLGTTILTGIKKDSFRITEELNKIPSFEFEIANCSDNRSTIAAGITEVFRIYRRINSVDILMFTGVINGDSIEYLSLERIRITGYASYIDLNWRFHQHLNSADAETVDKVFDYSTSTYAYQKKGSVNATTAGAQTNYQLELIVGESSGASGADVHCSGHCQDFPNDIRFTKEDGVTKHDYWIDTDTLEGITPNRKVSVWIEVASIPASGSVDFYMYYGKSSDAGESNGDNTFNLFDDFDEIHKEIHASNASSPIIDVGGYFAENFEYDPITDKYWLIFENRNVTPYSIGIAKADSPDGTWTVDTASLLSSGVAGHHYGCPCIKKFGSYWYIYYEHTWSGEYESYVQKSTTVNSGYGSETKVISKGASGWDLYRTGEPYVFKKDNTYYLFYMGMPTSSGPERVGYATCSTPDGTYTKWGSNPIPQFYFCRGEDNADPYVFEMNGTYYIGMTASMTPGITARCEIGFLKTTNFQTFESCEGQPALEVGSPGAWDGQIDGEVLRGGVTKVNNTYYMTYSGRSPCKMGITVLEFEQDIVMLSREKWVVYSAQKVEITSGILDINEKWTKRVVGYANSFGVNYALRTRSKMVGASGNYGAIGFRSEVAETSSGIFQFFSNYNATNEIDVNQYNTAWSKVYNVAATDTWHIFDICKLTDGTGKYYINGTIKATITDQKSVSARPLVLSYSEMDWLFIRKYVLPEPTWGTWGSEQSGGESFYIDRTTEANNDTINDVLVSYVGVNDILYIGQSEQFFGMQIKYSTKGVQAGSTTVVWEYSKGSSVWATLDVLDETRTFTEAVGTHYVTIPHKPSDWAKDTVNSVKKFWTRARISAGSYTTPPKLDRIKITNVDVYRVYYFETAADTIMTDVLAGTGYSMDVTDVCPSDTISIVAEYETKLRIIAGIANALTWDDSGDKKAYQWWIDTSKKVHFKQKRGATLGDITAELTILNNIEDYFNLSNRLHFFGNYDGLNQLRAIIENTDSQDTHEIRELAVPEERYNNYIPLKEAAQKAMTYTKAPLQKIAATVTTKYWLDNSFEVGDTVTLHKDTWAVDSTAFQIVRADIGPRVTNVDMGISQEHLDGLKAGLQRQLDITGIRMHGSTSLMQFGPEEMNYQRVDGSTVYPARMKFEIPSETRYIHKITLSWKLGPFRADVSGGEEAEGHDHDGYAGAGGAHDHDGYAGSGGAHDSAVLDGGAHTPTELGDGEHTHTDTGITLAYSSYSGYVLSDTTTGTESTHTHPKGSTGGPDDTDTAVYSLSWGTACTSGSCVQGTNVDHFALDTHWHLNTGLNTGSGSSHSHSLSTYALGSVVMAPITISVFSISTDLDHTHTINDVADHPHTAVAIAAHANHVIATQIAHGNHTIASMAAATINLAFGIHEIAGGTIMELIVNGETVASNYNGDQTDIVITGYTTTGSNTIEIQPAVGQNHKGSANMDGQGTIFIEAKKW